MAATAVDHSWLLLQLPAQVAVQMLQPTNNPVAPSFRKWSAMTCARKRETGCIPLELTRHAFIEAILGTEKLFAGLLNTVLRVAVWLTVWTV